MLDTVVGLPVHVLVVHAVVVGIPLMSLVTVGTTFRRPPPAWRWLVVAANTALLAVTVVAKESGEELERRVGADLVVEHSALGDRLPLFAAGVLAASVLVALVRRRDGLGRLVVVVAPVAAVAATVWAGRRVGVPRGVGAARGINRPLSTGRDQNTQPQ